MYWGPLAQRLGRVFAFAVEVERQRWKRFEGESAWGRWGGVGDFVVVAGVAVW